MAFDVITPIVMGRGQAAIAPTLTTFRTTPADTRDMVKTIDVANNGAGQAYVDLFLVPFGVVASDDNILLPNIKIPRNAVFQWAGVQILNAGSTIQARSSIAGVSIHVSGGEAI